MDKDNTLIYKLNKSDADVNQIMIDNKNLIYFVLTRLGCLNNQEYESAAYEGLWNAIQTFDVFGKLAFSTYAYTCMRNRINDMRRKDKIKSEHEACVDFTLIEFDMPICDCCLDIESVEAVDKIRAYTEEYINNMRDGNPKNVIKVWYASNFTMSEKNIAEICKTHPTNVSRVKATFRAYLQGKLRH